MDVHANLCEVIRTYHELNPAAMDELAEEPSALEFMRFVATNRPFVVRGGARGWRAYQRWNREYLRRKLDRSKVQVAVTPDGRADAPRRYEGSLYFAKPLERELDFSVFMDYVTQSPTNAVTAEEVWYAQTRALENDNLRGEYVDVFADVESEIRWASIALASAPDAVNMWIGSSKSMTAMHKDPYQNIFCQVVGQKHFVLISPIETACVNEQFLSPATWLDSETGLELRPDADAAQVPCALWDPNDPAANPSPLSEMCRPMRVTLDAGDMMYLPAMWYHQVTQSAGAEGFACSVNYWYDMEYSGAFFTHDQLLRLHSRAVVAPRK